MTSHRNSIVRTGHSVLLVAAALLLGVAGPSRAELGYGEADPALPMGELLRVKNLYGFAVPKNREVGKLMREGAGVDMERLDGALQVSGPTVTVGGRYIVAQGCRAHACNEVHAMVLVDTRERKVFSGIVDEQGATAWPAASAWPAAVTALVRSHEGSPAKSILGTASARVGEDVVDLRDVDGRVIFEHNGSEMVIDSDKGVIVYDTPKASIRNAVKPGQVLFRGILPTEGKVEGTAYTFKKGCTPAPYPVSGRWTNDDRPTLVLEGAAPKRAKDGCAVVGSAKGANSTLKFTFLVSP